MSQRRRDDSENHALANYIVAVEGVGLDWFTCLFSHGPIICIARFAISAIARSRSPAWHRRAKKERELARSVLRDPSGLSVPQVVKYQTLLAQHHGSKIPKPPLYHMSNGKTRLCGNCGYTRPLSWTHCSYCGTKPKFPRGLGRITVEKASCNQYEPAGSHKSKFLEIESTDLLGN